MNWPPQEHRRGPTGHLQRLESELLQQLRLVVRHFAQIGRDSLGVFDPKHSKLLRQQRNLSRRHLVLAAMAAEEQIREGPTAFVFPIEEYSSS